MGRILTQDFMVLSYYTSFDYSGNSFQDSVWRWCNDISRINTPTWRHIAFDENANLEGLDNYVDLLDEVKETTHIREFTIKQRIKRRFNIKVRKQGFNKGGMVLKKMNDPKKNVKLAPNREGPFCIHQEINNGAYKLESL